MTTQKYCKKCEHIVVYMPPKPTVGNGAIVFPTTCAGDNDIHFCMRNGKSFHDILQCECLTKKKSEEE